MSPNRTLMVSAALSAFVLVVAAAVASRVVGTPSVAPATSSQQSAPAEPAAVPAEIEIAAPTGHGKHGHHEKEHHHHDHDEDDDG